MMLFNILCISYDILDGIGLSILIDDFSGSIQVISCSTSIGICTGWRIRETCIELIFQACQWLPDVSEIHFSKTIDTYIPLATFCLFGLTNHWISPQLLRIHRINTVATIFIIHLSPRRHSLCIQEINTSSITVMRCNIGVSSHLQIIGNIHINIGAERITFIVESLQYTFLAQIITRNIVSDSFCTTCYTDIMVCNNSCL